MSNDLYFPVTLRLRSPFLFEALETSGFGIDGPALRDAKGWPILPGDHLRGHLSHAIRAIGSADPRRAHVHARLFGGPSLEEDESAPQNVPRRGIIDVPDFRAEPRYHCRESDVTDETRDEGPTRPLPRAGTHAGVRVEIDPRSGAASEGKLQFVELVAPQGAIVTFVGSIRIRADASEATTFRDLLSDALALIPAVGGSKTVGFGEVVRKHTFVGAATSASTSGAPAPATGDRFEVTVTFDRPLLVDGWTNATNVFRGGTIVPGAAIKGALAAASAEEADAGELRGALGAALSAVSISHAFPLVETMAGTVLGDRPLPLSLVATRDENKEVLFADCLRDEAWSALIDRSAVAVGHAIDWKHDDETRIRAVISRPRSGLERRPRGRVAIDDKGVAAKGQLFVVAPVETEGRTWRFVIDRNGADEDAFRRLLSEMAAGVPGIGRTGARMTVASWSEDRRPTVAQSLVRVGGLERSAWVVRLETGAMLTDPTCPLDHAEQYRRAFAALSGCEGLELVGHFARRKTIGGYMVTRHRRRGRRQYVTTDLTLPGAVFALAGEGVGAFLERAAATGLGAVHFVDGDAVVLTDWRVTPYVAENGWGRISVEPIDAGVRLAPAVAEEE